VVQPIKPLSLSRQAQSLQLKELAKSASGKRLLATIDPSQIAP
jgi:hypothetical protein